MNLNALILVVLILSALWTVMARSLIRSAIGLALTSAILTIMIFRLDSWLAGVFELSVCTGLISVLFVSTISLTQPYNRQEAIQFMKEKLSRFWYLPVIVIIIGIALSFLSFKINIPIAPLEAEQDARIVLWNSRQLDLMGQVIILLTGVLAVVILFKERIKK